MYQQNSPSTILQEEVRGKLRQKFLDSTPKKVRLLLLKGMGEEKKEVPITLVTNITSVAVT